MCSLESAGQLLSDLWSSGKTNVEAVQLCALLWQLWPLWRSVNLTAFYDPKTGFADVGSQNLGAFGRYGSRRHCGWFGLRGFEVEGLRFQKSAVAHRW